MASGDTSGLYSGGFGRLGDLATKVQEKVDQKKKADDALLASEKAYRQSLGDGDRGKSQELRDAMDFDKRKADEAREEEKKAQETLDKEAADAKGEGLTMEKIVGGLEVAADATAVYKLVDKALNPDDPTITAPSPGDTLEDLYKVAGDPDNQARQQIANDASKFGPNRLLGDEAIKAAFAARTDQEQDFNTWLIDELGKGSQIGLRINDLTSPLAVEARERAGRLTEAEAFFDTYDSSQFRSPESRKALTYATHMADDPLDVQLGEYIGGELRGEYSPEFYRDIREKTFGDIDPSMQATSFGLGQALLGSEGAMRGRQQHGAVMAEQRLGRKMAYAPSYASMAQQAPDPLAITGLGKMGIGGIQPMAPTGPFFGSFPASAAATQQANLAAQTTLGDRITALQTAAERLNTMFGEEKDPLYPPKKDLLYST